MAWLIRHAVLLSVMLVTVLATPATNAETTKPALAPETSATESALVVPPASAAEPSYGTKARLIEAVRPNYPYLARRDRREGWVQLSFTIRPDGTVANPIVEDSTGVVEFERAAIAAILKSRYEPATWQGRPIEQCASRFRYQFVMYGDQIGARPTFVRSWKEAAQLMEEQRYEEAAARLDAMDREGTWSNYEIARLWLLRASLQARTGDKEEQLRSLRRATVGHGSDLEQKLYREALLQRFALEVQLSEFGAALDTHEEMKASRPALVDPRVERATAEIERKIHSQDTFAFPGVIGFRSGCAEGRPNWQHQLLRRTFAFSDLEGQVDDFELRCDWKRVVDKVSPDKTWQVPASWGYCEIYVFGAQGARLKLVELPLASGEKRIERPRRDMPNLN